MHLRVGTGVGVASLLALALALSGCGNGDEAAAGPSPTETPTSATSEPTGSPSPYVEVPSGIDLTSPGMTLPVKDPAVVAWYPRQGQVGVVDLRVTRIEVTTVTDAFPGFEVDHRTSQSTPYFVHVKVTNVGTSSLGGRTLPLYVRDSDGVLVEATGIAEDYAACPHGTLPDTFAGGDRATSCLVFLTPRGTTLTSVVFRPPEGVDPVSWVGDAKPIKGPIKGTGAPGHHRHHSKRTP